MNWDAYHEREHNKRYISAHYRKGCKVLEIVRHKVKYHGRKYIDCSTHDKRKFETNLLLEHMDAERIPTKFLYL